MPDLDGGVILPWQPEMAWFPSDLTLRDEPFAACSRQVLRRSTAAAAEAGYTFNLGIETHRAGRDAGGHARGVPGHRRHGVHVGGVVRRVPAAVPQRPRR